MNNRQKRRVGTIQPCLQVLKGSKFNDPGTLALRDDLEKQYEKIQALEQAQNDAKRLPTHSAVRTRNLKEEMLKSLRMISRRATAVLKGLPGLKDEMRIPRANMKTADFLDGTARLIKNVKPHLDTLYAKGLSKTVIPHMEKLAAELHEESTTVDPAIGLGAQATLLLPAAIQDARDIIDAIDANIHALYPRDAEADKASFASVKRIPGRVGRPKPRKNGRRPANGDGASNGR